MASVTPTFETYGDDIIVASWTLTSANTDGLPVGPNYASYADRCVQVTGTAGTAGAFTIQGSNDKTNWGLLNDLFGGDLNNIAINIPTSIAELPLYTRPLLGTAGSGATLVFTMVMRKARSGRAAGG